MRSVGLVVMLPILGGNFWYLMVGLMFLCPLRHIRWFYVPRKQVLPCKGVYDEIWQYLDIQVRPRN